MLCVDGKIYVSTAEKMSDIDHPPHVVQSFPDSNPIALRSAPSHIYIDVPRDCQKFRVLPALLMTDFT